MANRTQSRSHSQTRDLNTGNSARTPIDEDVQAMVWEKLSDDVTVTESWKSRDLCNLIRRADGYTTLHVTLPLVAKTVYNATSSMRRKHVNIRGSAALEVFAQRLIGSQGMLNITRLDIVVDSISGVQLLGTVIESLQGLECLAFRHVIPRRDGQPRVVSWNHLSTPQRLVRALGCLSRLQVLVIVPGATVLTVRDVHDILRGCKALRYLHIPCSLHSDVTHSQDTVEGSRVVSNIRTLSVGYPGRHESTNVFEELLGKILFAGLVRLNVLGMVSTDLMDFVSTLGTVQQLETISSNRKIWEAFEDYRARDSNLPLVERLDVHVADFTGSMGVSLPHLRVVTIIDDIHYDDREGWDARLSMVLESVQRLKTGSPRLHRVEVVFKETTRGDNDAMRNFANEMRNVEVHVVMRSVKGFV